MQNGIILTLLGMTVVFLFLILLVFTTTGMSKVLLKYFPEREKADKGPTSVDVEVAVAIAAVMSHTES